MNHVTVQYPDNIKPEETKKYIAYKGFDKDLKCKGFQFEVGKAFSTGCTHKPVLCSKDGFHYCDDLKDCFVHYSHNGKNRFCEIEITGQHTKGGDKGISTDILIVREISHAEIDDIIMDELMNIETVKELQTQNPLLQIGGSVALYLYGIRLPRFKQQETPVDFDICMPFWNEIKSSDKIDLGINEDVQTEKFYNNDFSETIFINGTKADIRIDPKQKYEMVEYKGFKYRCAPFEVIMEAKFRYAVRGNAKHKEDVRAISLPGYNKKTLIDEILQP